MSEVQMEFEANRSFGYRFTRYVVLPEGDLRGRIFVRAK